MPIVSIPELLSERSSQRLFYAYDGDSMSYGYVTDDGQVLCVDFIPENLPALQIYSVPDVEAWYEGMSEAFFGLYDEGVRRELRETAAARGVTLSARVTELLDDANYE